MESLSNTSQLTEAGEAFSRQAPHFDAIDDDSRIIKWMRQRVYAHLYRFLKPGDRILELNAGTGIDACYLAGKGHDVVATDISETMLQQADAKIATLGLQDHVKTLQCSYTELDKLQEGKFDLIFSNFGGLNCVDDFSRVARNIPDLLNPGGHVSLVMITPFCLWEFATFLNGNFKLAFRRFKKNGAPSNLEGVEFRTFYFQPSQIKMALGRKFRVQKVEGLATITPPPYLEHHFKSHPRLLNAMFKIDEISSGWPLFKVAGDHFIITLQYLPDK